MRKQNLHKKHKALPATVAAGKHLTLYRDMSAAIARCSRVDQCRDIADRSVGLAAYYAQIKDTEIERMFYQVKLRAWRRIGELFSVVDLSDCLTQSAKIKKIRAGFDDAVVAKIADSMIAKILQLTALSDADFEFALKRITSGGLETLLQQHTPQAVAQLKANRDRAERRDRAAERERAKPENQKKLLERLAQERMQQRHEDELLEASEAALEEVGITLERKDRANMKQVVFLIREEVHAVMRQAAFDQRITMQELLRRGLKTWLTAHGYEFPERQAAATKYAQDARGEHA